MAQVHNQNSSSGAGHYRRFKGYDYSRGAAIFITFCVAGRAKIFGCVDARGSLVHSPAGQAAMAALEVESRRGNGVEVKASVIMPDHVHVRLYLRPGVDRPLAKIAQFVSNLKRWSKHNCSKVGVEVAWEKGYHDRLCLSREIMELADKYIANNPMKWHLMHGNPPPLKVVEPLTSIRLPGDAWWSAVGALGLASLERRICAVRLSRRIPEADYSAITARLMKAVDRGYILAGTFISPCERVVAKALDARGAPMIRAVPDALAMVYRPKCDEPRQFAEGRLLLLSRVAAPGSSRSEAWHGINSALADFACAAPGGLSVYARSARDFCVLRPGCASA